MRKNKVLSELRGLIEDIECGYADLLTFTYEVNDDYGAALEKIHIEFQRPDVEPEQSV